MFLKRFALFLLLHLFVRRFNVRLWLFVLCISTRLYLSSDHHYLTMITSRIQACIFGLPLTATQVCPQLGLGFPLLVPCQPISRYIIRPSRHWTSITVLTISWPSCRQYFIAPVTIMLCQMSNPLFQGLDPYSNVLDLSVSMKLVFGHQVFSCDTNLNPQ